MPCKMRYARLKMNENSMSCGLLEQTFPQILIGRAPSIVVIARVVFNSPAAPISSGTSLPIQILLASQKRPFLRLEINKMMKFDKTFLVVHPRMRQNFFVFGFSGQYRKTEKSKLLHTRTHPYTISPGDLVYIDICLIIMYILVNVFLRNETTFLRRKGKCSAILVPCI